MKLIVGLGNPGKEYENTRHNIGFMILDYILNIKQIDNYKEKLEGKFFEINIEGEKIIFLKPQKYMNDSGRIIKKYKDYFKINNKDILVIHDEVDIDLGKYKIKKDCGDAGHNGIKSIDIALQSKNYNRLRIGIKKKSIMNRTNFVLKKFAKRELKIIEEMFDIYYNIIMDFVNLSYEDLTNKYN